jgi:hypothetical protein
MACRAESDFALIAYFAAYLLQFGEEKTTMHRTLRIISALLFCSLPTAALAQTVVQPKAVDLPLELVDGAPSRHVVVPGETLWDIASKYLKQPYRWGELWQLNAQEIKNPQRLYPGQVLLLDKSGGQPRLKLATVTEQRREYVEENKKPIASIAPDAIEPFLSEPRVVEEHELERALRVVGVQDNRVIAGAGDRIYTTPPDVFQEKQRSWQVFRAGQPLKNPDSREVLGHEAYFLGTAVLTQEGKPSVFTVKTSREEIAPGDRLLPAPRQDVPTYVPRAPTSPIQAQILTIYGGVNFSGPQSVVTLNKGKADGLEPGHVLVTNVVGDKVDDRFKGEKTSYQLPPSRNGTLFVFRVFDRVSYALVVGAIKPVEVGDNVVSP